MSQGYVGRLAPSPTGLLHLGHARTFWLAAQRAQGGSLLLRNEDLDYQRSRAEFAEAMREDLRWLGIWWTAELQQSTRIAAYRQALDQLLAAGFVYPCVCSRKDLQQAAQAPHEDTDDEPLYTGRCRSHTIRVFQPNTNYRFQTPDHEAITFTDNHVGIQTFTTAVDFSDFLVWRKDGLPSYQLACAVDDAFQQITEVVRGRDLLKSTARQILLQHALGLHTPEYFHCDLLRDEQGIRLAKRHDAMSLRAFREQGLTPQQVLALF